MFDFDNDGDFDLDDIIEADVRYGLFEEDDRIFERQLKYNKKKSEQITLGDVLKCFGFGKGNK